MFKNLLKITILLWALLLLQSCQILAIPVALPLIIVGEEFVPKVEQKKSFFGDPYLGFRTNVESMTGKDVFGHVMDNPLKDAPGFTYAILLPGNLVMGTLFLPFDLWALAFERGIEDEVPDDKEKPDKKRLANRKKGKVKAKS
jgi:hypothetical protein